MALSALHRLHGLAPSHFDFFRRQRSHALHTLFLTLSCDDSMEPDRWDDDMKNTLRVKEQRGQIELVVDDTLSETVMQLRSTEQILLL